MRHPVEYIKVYRDTCRLTFGVSCPAVLDASSPNKCHNTIATCPVKNSYHADTHVDVFYNPDNFPAVVTTEILDDAFDAAYPFLQQVRHSPATINPAGGGSGSGPLGTRATLNVTLIDGRSNDRLQDKYYLQRISGQAQNGGDGYNPDERSTFLIKYLARNKYLYARRVEYITGYIDTGVVTNKKTRTFVVKDVGAVNDSGLLTIGCQDPLFLTNLRHAQAPRPSDDVLLMDFPDTLTGMVPNTVMQQYGLPTTNGFYAISGEIIRVSAGVPANITKLINRQQLGTTVDSHSEGSTVQRVLVFSNVNVVSVIRTLLENYTDITSVGDFIDLAQWNAKVAQYQWLEHNYTGYIAEPTAVQELLDDIAEQMQFYPYWNEETAKLNLAANVPAPPVQELQNAKKLDEYSHIIADSLRIAPKYEQVLTRVFVHHGIRNWAESLDDSKNYKTVHVFADLTEENNDHRRSATSRDVFGYFLDGTLAVEVGENIAELYREPPYDISFSLDAKDNDLKLADFFTIRTRLVADALGQEMWLAGQIISAAESVTGSRWDYKAVALNFGEGSSARPTRWPILISDDRTNVNIKNIFDATYPTYVPRNADTIEIVVAANVTIGSNSTASAALLLNIPQAWVGIGVTVVLVTESGSRIVGAGGRGGNGGRGNIPLLSSGLAYDYYARTLNYSTSGENGGVAISSMCSFSLDNRGQIGGGGGGGGGGQVAFAASIISQFDGRGGIGGGGGGGGGQGSLVSQSGTGGTATGGYRSEAGAAGVSGSIADRGIGGQGGSTGSNGWYSVSGGSGGAGGGLGENGLPGSSSTAQATRPGASDYLVYQSSGSSGGLAGAAIAGAQVTIISNTGQILGSTTA